MFTAFPGYRPGLAVIRDFHCSGFTDTAIDSDYENAGIEEGWLILISWYRDEDNRFVRVYAMTI